MKPKVWLMFPLILAGLLVGCIEFEQQTMSYRYDSAADTLYIFQDYQGIFGGDNAQRLETEEVEQLNSVMKSERTFFFNNWITEFNRLALTEALTKAKGELEEDAQLEAAYRDVAKLALESVKVENVGLYHDKRGRLCGAQRVTMRNFSKLLPKINRVLREYARTEMAKDGATDEDKALTKKFLDRGEPALTLDGNRLEIRWPVGAEDFTKFKDSAPGKALVAAGGKMDRVDGQIVIKVGEPKAESVSVTLPFSEKAYVANASSEAKPYGIKESFDPVKAAKEFLAARNKAKD
jgi:hypothetical protein